MTENNNIKKHTVKVLHVDDVFDPSYEMHTTNAFQKLHSYLADHGIEVVREGNFDNAISTLRQIGTARAVILDLKRAQDQSFVGIDLIIALNRLPAQQRPMIIVYTRFGEQKAEVQQAIAYGARWVKKDSNDQTYGLIYAAIIGS